MHLTEVPSHVRTNEGEELKGAPYFSHNKQYSYGLVIPHRINSFLNKTAIKGFAGGNNATAIIKNGSQFKKGTEFTSQWGFVGIVTKITERRKARGNWDQNPFDKNPDFVAFEYEPAPPKEA